MSAVTEKRVREQLRAVKDPELGADLVSLGMVKNVAISGSAVRIHVELTTPACPLKEQIAGDIKQAVGAIPGVEDIQIEWSANVRSSRPAAVQLPGVKNVVAVGAGKGGVGKSTAAVLLAYGLRDTGASVGILDADVYGPSIPTMTGIEGATPKVRDNMIVPPLAGGVKIMSIGFMIDRDKPLMWRGPMTHGVIKQFLEQVDWGELDYLIVDLPPGTGDVPLSLAQSVPMTGSVVICTPQDIALSYFVCPSCGHREEPFDHGGAATAAEELGVPFLGEIPLNAKIRVYGDGGSPERVFSETDGFVSEAIRRVVANTAGQISVRSSRQAVAPTLSVE
jgi:ATP-binding protein involved in chromosome partitioning